MWFLPLTNPLLFFYPTLTVLLYILSSFASNYTPPFPQTNMQNYYYATTGSVIENPNEALTEGVDSSTLTSSTKSHKEAERRRRHRINAHLSTLRSLLPNVIKTDKASLLAEVVTHVKDLKRQAADVARHSGESWPFPAELDEATLTTYCDNDSDSKTKLLKATVCCEDRPGLNRDLTRAIRSVRARPVRAEMVTVGGRAKSVVVLKWANGEEQFRALKRALKAVVENRTAHVLSGKRSRVYSSVDYEAPTL